MKQTMEILVKFAFLMFFLFYFISLCWAQEENVVDFDFIYGRIVGGFNLDGWGLFSDREPIWEGKAGWGKKDLFSVNFKDEFNDSYKRYYKKILELPTISGSLSLKSNWRISLGDFDYSEIKYNDEGKVYETINREIRKLRNRSTDWHFTLGFFHLTKGGKIYVPEELLNFSYYQGVFLNKGQIGITGNDFEQRQQKEFKTLMLYDSGARVWQSSDSRYTHSRPSIRAIYGINDSWNLETSGTYDYYRHQQSYSIYAPDSALADTNHYYPYTYLAKSVRQTKRGESSVELRGLIGSRFLGAVRYDFGYAQSTSRSEREDQKHPKQISKRTDKSFSHLVSMKIVYLSPNPDISIKRIVDDYSDYYGHLLNQKQIRWEANLSFTGEVNKYGTRHPYERKFLRLKYESELGYGLTERVNIASSVHMTKDNWCYDRGYYHHTLSLNYDFGLVLYTYSYDKDYREDISWQKVSDFDYLFGPLLSKGQSQLEIAFSPRGYSRRWTSSSGNLLQFKKPEFMKEGIWSIKPEVKLGLTDFLQFSFKPTFLISSSQESMSSTTSFDSQIWSNCRLTFSYYRESWSYLPGGSSSSTYNITVRLNLLI